MTLEQRKLGILEWVIKLSNERTIDQLYSRYVSITEPVAKELDPTEHGVSYCDLVRITPEQALQQAKENYVSPDLHRVKHLIAELDIQETTEELLADLGK